MHQYKSLHIATGIDNLNHIALNSSLKLIQLKKPAALLNVAKRLYTQSQNDPYDEEMTYIMLSRFIQVYDSVISSHDDQNFVGMMLGQEARKAKAQIADLKNNLINRYEEQSVKQAAALIISPVIYFKKEKHPSIFNNAFISCAELFSAYSNKNINLLIMDARSEKDYNESHIKDVKCINIPENCIQSGLSAHTLEATLPTTSLEQWNRRDMFDVIVLMDWNTSKTNFTASKLDKLRVILVEWDMNKTYNEKPVVLNDGYIEFLEMYPMLCTSSDVKYTKVNTELDDLLNLENIEYPTESDSKSHDVFSKELIRETTLPKVTSETREDILKEEKLVIEESKKISKALLKEEQQWKDIHNRIAQEYDISKLEKLKEEEKRSEDTISKLAEEENVLLERKSNLANHFNLGVSFKPGEVQDRDTAAKLEDIDNLQQECLDIVKARQELSNDRQRLLDEARQTKKPRITNEFRSNRKPMVDRGTKPKDFLPKMITHMEGRFETVENGLTGLSNIKNTCYMNTIIQCLRHVPEIIDFYCKADYANHIKRSPVISNEVAHLVRALWSNTYSVIRPSEFYRKFTALSPVYKAGYHEDCLEFFLTLYNYLSEDCALDISSRNYWSETQMAWYKQHGGKISFYINIFYHQIRIQHSCGICKTSNLKFDIENIFYLSVPDKPFKLEESMKSYLTSKEKLICKKCKSVKDIEKSISYYPTILVIALKRHIQDFKDIRTVHYKKNDNQCYFPIDDFKVGNCVYTLRAIALHIGNMETGHYTAACLNPSDKRWYVFNDDNVSEVDINDASFKTKAYAFFYSFKKSHNNNFNVINKELYQQKVINS